MNAKLAHKFTSERDATYLPKNAEEA